jgi:hypothetical protein
VESAILTAMMYVFCFDNLIKKYVINIGFQEIKKNSSDNENLGNIN